MTGRTLAAGMLSDLGPIGPFVGIGITGVVMALTVAGVNWWVRRQRSREVRPDAEKDTVEACHAYRRYVSAAARADGSMWDWDHSVRPVLGGLVELTMAELEPGGDPRETARERLGDQLWALVDRDARRSGDRRTPGAGHHTLLRILDQVEIR